jgi:hypothetical protein
MRWLGALAPLVVIGLVAAAPHLAGAIHQEAAGERTDERLYYPDAGLLRHASLGFTAPAADYAWLQATQYYGGYRRGEHDLRYFRGLIDAVTELDPRFVEAYHFASLVLSLDHADFAGALDILRAGILANPDHWQLHFDVGFIHYVFLQEYAVASHWFEAAAQLPGSTDFCRRFAAFSRRRAGDLEGSILLWDHLRQTTDSTDMRELAEQEIARCQGYLAGAPRPGMIGPPTPRLPEETP